MKSGEKRAVFLFLGFQEKRSRGEWRTPPGTAQPACESPRRMTVVYLYGPGATRQQL